MGAWIETDKILLPTHRYIVAPFVGAWIETDGKALTAGVATSLPSWERGLKPCLLLSQFLQGYSVAPFVGAWIETARCGNRYENFLVAPFVGAWIETSGG